MNETTPPAGSGAMFDAIAARYDLLNRLLSLGLDVRWRRRLVDALALKAGQRVLDLATGTADVALAIAAREAGTHVVGLDPSEQMLAVGRRKVLEAKLSTRVELVAGDAQSLPFPDASFDAVTISFGIRNVPDRPCALREMRRVLRPGGRLAVLELAEPDGRLLGSLARFHVHEVVPRLGALLSGQREYRYLHQSIERFPHRSAFSRTIEEAGFTRVVATPLTFGACVLFTGDRPEVAT